MVDVKDMNKIAISLDLAKDVVTKDYLYKLGEYEIVEIPDTLKHLNISQYTRIYKFTKLVSDQNENVNDKLVTVLNAAYTSNATVITLIAGHKTYTEYYIGVVSKDVEQENQNIETQGKVLKGALTGNFTGLQIDAVRGTEKEQLLENIFAYDYITSISGIASIRNEKDKSYEKYVQGMEHLVDSLRDKEYNIVIIADPIDAQGLSDAQQGYEMLYTQLSPFIKSSVSFNETETITLTQSHTDGVTESIGRSTALTQGYSETSGWSDSVSRGKNRNKNIGAVISTVVGAGIGIAATVLTGGAAAPIVAAGVGAAAGVVGGVVGSTGENSSETSTQSGSTTETSSNTITDNQTTATQNSDTESEAQGETHGKTVQLTNENRTIKSIMDKIDGNIERLQKCEAYGAFNCATYVVSSDPETNAIVSSGYNALMRGDNSFLQASYINNWSATDYMGKKVKEYLARFAHPLFKSPVNSEVILSPAVVSNSYEVAVSMGLPKKSINGFSVLEMASFGRNVLNSNSHSQMIELGELYHMNMGQNNSVKIDLNSLTSHMFITGSTGTGKSNTIYKLLEKITKIDSDIHFMVVEPAKGEYKHAFYKHPRIKTQVYGTNPKKTPLLRINPFAFPEDIHVLEHVDRLVEIMNVCWPMYAAMPAILKNAVIKAYEKCGWDITNSYIPGRKMEYPCFADVLECINEILETSAFSDDNKGDYTGALCTRVESLTTGMNGQIFINDELSDMELFDQNVIIDLSRIGSVETKSLIMGILVMKLQEYRMASQMKPNQSLKHIMVLEEAHNLLKKTSTEQSADAGNLVGKSVEMLTNAIAEMRTYGEGFFIVDQAPDLLDAAVIRNTNTKIVLRLPEGRDRELVGKSMALSDEQIVELSKLEKGCAVVYQNDWEEAVLCKFEQYHKDYRNVALDDELFEYKPTGRMLTQSDKKKNVLRALLDVAIDEGHKEEKDNLIMLEKNLSQLAINYNLKREIRRILMDDKRHSLDEIAGIVTGLYDCKGAIEKARYAGNVEEWNDIILCNVDSGLRLMSNYYIDLFIQCVLLEQLRKNPDLKPYVEDWMRYTKEVR